VTQRNALIVFGGWPGHRPREAAEVFRRLLEAEGFSVELSDSLAVFEDAPKLERLDLIVPNWTMGQITDEQLAGVCGAVRGGVGLAGCHGMCDAFRLATEWQFMTGGQWVAHPGGDGVKQTIHIVDPSDPITAKMSDFQVCSERYYLHVDPAVKVLATTHFPVADGPHLPNGPVEMPAVWTKRYGRGRVFYCSLGHAPAIVQWPPVLELMRRGCLWAAQGRR
jgi:uncharacterized protein